MASTLLRQIALCNRVAIEKTGDIDREGVADLLEASLARDRRRTLIDLAEFVALALDGSVTRLK